MPFNDMRATSRNCQDQRRKMSSSEASKNANASSAPSGGPTDGQDLTVFVQSLLEQMQSRSLLIGVGALDEMGSRIDELEKSIADLMEQTNEDGSDKPQEPAASEAAAAKDKGESV
ncbi:hypothetical protein Pcac1_g11993 [Phytophthora cactorum]|nr:hypothetical protein Pcac1_g11993 [Phytophthora cactorum]